MTPEPLETASSRSAERLSEPLGPGERGRGRAGWVWWIIALGLLGAGGYWLYPYAARWLAKPADQTPAPGAGRGVPVLAAEARKGDMSLYLTGLGSVTALNTVTLRTRVDGELTKVAFVEGQFVRQGDLLVEIDPRPFQVQLDQARGQLAKDEATLKNARLDLERNEQAKEAVPARDLATAAATVKQYEGIVQSDQAQVDNAKLQLVYCRITAPITGRIGLRLIDQGNIVHANDQNGLAVITQLQPIAVLFTIPQDQISSVLQRMKPDPALRVEAYGRDLRTRLAVGKLVAIDNQVDPSTGTVRLKAEFPNENEALFPNQFVNARLLIDTRKDAVIVPTAAVQRKADQSTFVYVVKKSKPKEPKSDAKEGSVVDERVVAVGPSEGEETVIETGLDPGEVVVTEGVDRLQKGTKVSVRMPERGAKPKASP